MRMRGKVVAILATLIVAVLVAQHFIATSLVMPKFLALEEQKADRDIHRVQMALEMNLEQMAGNVTDYAQWDEMYAFAASRDPSFAQSSLSPRVFENLCLNCILIYDPEGRKLWGETRDYVTAASLRIAGVPEGDLPNLHKKFRDSASTATISGFLACGDQVMLVATSPILTSKGEGPSRGRVIFGRLLLPAELEHLSKQVRVEFSLRHYLPDTAARREKTADQNGEILLDCISENQLHVFLPLEDLFGKPIRWIAADIPRRISAEGREVLRGSEYIIGVAGILILAAAYWCFGHFVVKPVEKFIRHVQWIRQSGDLAKRINSPRTDEVGVLASEFDLLLSALAKDRVMRRRYERRLHSLLQEKSAGRDDVTPCRETPSAPAPPLGESTSALDAPPALPLP